MFNIEKKNVNKHVIIKPFDLLSTIPLTRTKDIIELYSLAL